jgi:hypothetical protein
MVNNESQEEYYRSQGYIGATEAMPNPDTNYREYPVMLYHPKHKDAVYGQEMTAPSGVKIGTNILIVTEPEQYPPKVANSPHEEEALRTEGYRRIGETDPDAFDKAERGTLLDNGSLLEDKIPQPFPMWVKAPGAAKAQIVNDAAEFERVMGEKWVDPNAPEEPEQAPEPQIDADELAAFRAWKAGQLPNVGEVVTLNGAPHRVVAEAPSEVERLRSQLAEAGISYDKRWGEKRLRAALESAKAA